MAKFVYRGKERTTEDISRSAKQAGGTYDSYIYSGFARLKVKEGENQLRILPPTWEDLEKYGNSWHLSVFTHGNVGPDRGNFLCLDKMLGKPCPVCEARADCEDEDERDQLRVGWRGLAWVINRNDEKTGPQIWDFPPTLFKDVMARGVDKKSNTPVLFDDPESGYDIFFNREGTTQKTKYTQVDIDREPSFISENEKLQERWLQYITDHPLPDTLNYHGYDYIKKVLSGKARKKSEDGDVSDDRSSRRPARHEDSAEETTSRRSERRSRETEEEVPSEGSERSRRSEPEDDKSDEHSERSERRSRDAEESNGESEGKSARNGSVRRTRAGEADAADEDPPSQARRTLSRLRERVNE